MLDQKKSLPKDIVAVADRLGVGVARFLNRGDDGAAYLLDNGRVLRRTSSKQEVAIALALQEAALAGIHHSAFPEIHGVWWFPDEVKINGQMHGFHGTVIVREEMRDVPLDEVTQCSEEVWKNALECFSYGWANGKLEYLDFALKKDRTFVRLYEAVMWAKENLGVKIVDLGRISNLGMRGSQIGIRDFSRAFVPDALLERVKVSGFSELPATRPRISESLSM